MIHGLNNNFLYAVSLINTHFIKKDEKKEETRQGTGFFVTKEDKGYFITNRHVIDITREGKQFEGYELDSIVFDVRKFDDNNKKVITETLNVNEFELTLPDDDLDDVACLSNFKVQGNGATVENHFPFDMLADEECLEKQISVCDSIATIGFPVVFDHLNNMPILRAGVVSSDPRLNYSYSKQYMGHVIAYEAFSTGGASGSPVIALQKGFQLGVGLNGLVDFYRPLKIIGINTGCMNVNGVHQQMSYMFKSDIIIDLILEAERSNNE